MATVKSENSDRPMGAPSSSTEDRLRKSAISLFAQKGYTATSIREIIEAAEVTRPVLYYYFKNKEELYTELITSEFEKSTQQVREVYGSTLGFREKLVEVVRGIFEHAESSPGLVQMMLGFFFSADNSGISLDRDEISRERFELLTLLMAEGMAEGSIGAGSPQAYALVFSGMADMHVMAWARRPEARFTDDMAEALVDLFLNGTTRLGTDGRPALASKFYDSLVDSSDADQETDS